jgi:sterol desaturase/sphingolipid hydroxylase (fatty acid hydroxylase superfamily)
MNHLVKHQTENGLRDKLNILLFLVLLLSPLIFIAGAIRENYFLFHLLLLLTGGLAWTGTEYYFHRFIMHNNDHLIGTAKVFNHTHHHTDPADIRVTTPHRIVMITGSIVFIALSVRLNNYFTLFCGYFVGFTVFCLMHVVLHHSWSKRLFPQLHRFHIHHHCKHPDKCFGVTLTWWDHLFDTIPENEKKISNRILEFYYKREKQKKKIISLNNIMDEKIQIIEKRSA